MKKKEKSEGMRELDSILTAFSQELFPEEISAEPEQTVSQAFPEKKPISAKPAKGSAGLFLPERMYEPESREASAADQAFTKDESSGAAPEEAEGMNDEEIETFIAMWSSSYEGKEYSCPSLFSDAGSLAGLGGEGRELPEEHRRILTREEWEYARNAVREYTDEEIEKFLSMWENFYGDH